MLEVDDGTIILSTACGQVEVAVAEVHLLDKGVSIDTICKSDAEA